LKARALLEALHAHACKPERRFLHTWGEGDIVIWDNRCVLHRGHEWDRKEARIMHRTTVAGDGDHE
jgi:alpha-ketoglutarate-dependent taurine dioxygenase